MPAPERPEPIDLFMDRQRQEVIQELADQLTNAPDWAGDLQEGVERVVPALRKELTSSIRRLTEQLAELSERQQEQAQVEEGRLKGLEDTLSGVPAWAATLQSDAQALPGQLTAALEDIAGRLKAQAAQLAEERREAAASRARQLEALSESVVALDRTVGEVGQALGEGQSKHASELAALRESLEQHICSQAEQTALARNSSAELGELARRLARPWYRKLLG